MGKLSFTIFQKEEIDHRERLREQEDKRGNIKE